MISTNQQSNDNPYGFWEIRDTPETIRQFGTEETGISGLCDLIKTNPIIADSFFFKNSIKIAAFQRVTIRAIWAHKFIYLQAIRGSAKSYIIARALLGLALTHKLRIVLTGPTFRQALHIFNYIETLIQENSGAGLTIDLSKEVVGNIVKGSMEARLKLRNGSVIKVLPMADGSKLRGERADILVNDEGFKLEETMYRSHIVPFLQKPQVPGAPEAKLIIATSAENQECFAYRLLLKWLKKVEQETPAALADKNYQRKYCILDWNYDDLMASGMHMEDDIIAEILNGASDAERERVLYNKWISMAGQFFPANMIEKMRNPEVFIEHERQTGYSYGLSVDVATQKDGDAFVIHVWKFLGSRKAAIVNTYWEWGLSADEMAKRILEIDSKFDPRWIIMDWGGGGLYVANSLSKRKLIDRDGKEYKNDDPILIHDEENVNILGRRKLILNKPNDPLVRAAFAGERARGGEEIRTQDMFVHLLYESMRNILLSHEPMIFIPGMASEEGDEYDRSEVKIYDQIQESIYQLRFLTVKMIENPDGTKEVARSKTAKVPLYTWKTSRKDGASAFSYGFILYLLNYLDERGAKAQYTGPRVRVNTYGQTGLEGLYDDPSQYYNPFAQGAK